MGNTSSKTEDAILEIYEFKEQVSNVYDKLEILCRDFCKLVPSMRKSIEQKNKEEFEHFNKNFKLLRLYYNFMTVQMHMIKNCQDNQGKPLSFDNSKRSKPSTTKS